MPFLHLAFRVASGGTWPMIACAGAQVKVGTWSHNQLNQLDVLTRVYNGRADPTIGRTGRTAQFHFHPVAGTRAAQ